MENKEQLIEYFKNVIEAIRMINNQASKQKFDDDFLIMISEEIEILNIETMIFNNEFKIILNDYFLTFFKNFYLFENNENHILYKLENIYEIKSFHENQIVKYFDDEFSEFCGISFLYIFPQLINKIRTKNKENNFNDDFLKLESKWWIYYMKYTGQYEKLKKIIIQRILNNNILVENKFNMKFYKYNLFLEYLNKYSIQNSKITKLLFITLMDGKNKIEWFNLFSNLEIKDFKKYNKIVDYTKKKILELLDKWLNLNPLFNISSINLYSVLTDSKIGHLFLKNKITLEKSSVYDIRNSDPSFFICMIYILKYNNQEKNIFKFVNEFNNYIMNKKNLEIMNNINLDNSEEDIKYLIEKNIENLVDPKSEEESLRTREIFDIWKKIFPSLVINEDVYNDVVENNDIKKDAINYLNSDFDNDVNEFCRRNKKISYIESNLKLILKDDENNSIDKLNKQNSILDFLIIFKTLEKKQKLSIKERDGLLSYFVNRLETIFENKYQVIKTNYSLLNKINIINDLNKFLDDEYKFSNIDQVNDDIWKTFIEYDLLSLSDNRIWSNYEEKGDKLYAIIINKLIVKGNLREARDKSIYESSIFQDKILKKLNIKKHLIKSDILFKNVYKNADYLEYLLFSLHENYSFEVAESFLINLLKHADEFIQAKERDIPSLVRVPLLCLDENREEYYKYSYSDSFKFHIRLIESIKDFYLLELNWRHKNHIPYWPQISEKNANEIFEILTKFFEENFKSFDKYFQNKFKKEI